MDTFFKFVLSLQSKLYNLAPTFVFDVNTYSPTSRLFTIDSFVSLPQAATDNIWF